MKYNLLALSLLALTACNAEPHTPAKSMQAFTDNVRSFCGQAFAGKIISKDAADEEWRKEDIKMHVRDCTGDEIKIALHVGENRSRTWILRDEGGVFALRHDHRHEDGKPDALTFYGGHLGALTDTRAEFPADQSTKDLFDHENIPVSKANIWAMEARPKDGVFLYEMRRPNRDFRIEFDTSNPIPAPPTPWGGKGKWYPIK